MRFLAQRHWRWSLAHDELCSRARAGGCPAPPSQGRGAGLALAVPLIPQEEATSGGVAKRWGEAVVTHTRAASRGSRTGSKAAWPQSGARPTPGEGRHSTLGTLSQAAWRLGLGWKVLKAQGQETLWVPGTTCSAAGGSDVGAVLCSLLGECGPRVGRLCPLPGLCQWVLGWPTVALASKSRLGLPACGELYASAAVVELRGRGPGGGWAAPPEDSPTGAPNVHCWMSPELPRPLGLQGDWEQEGPRTHTEVPQTDLSAAPAPFGGGPCAGRVALFLKHRGAFARVSHIQSEARLRAGPSVAADTRVSGFY